jgi:hypothetical protein
MVPTAFTTATWLSTLLRRWVRKGYGANIALAENGAISPTPLESGEEFIAVIRADDGRDFVLTDVRVVEAAETLFVYTAVVRCHWITDDPNWKEAARLKRTHFHRLIVELADERRIVVERIGQAVFPLLRFLKSIASSD